VRIRRSPYSPRWNAELLRTSGGVTAPEFVNKAPGRLKDTQTVILALAKLL
jgi:hypothetical protein